MIRKLLVVAAASQCLLRFSPVSLGSSVASAKALPPETGTCSISGAVTFAAPGITTAGAITNKTRRSRSRDHPVGLLRRHPIKTKSRRPRRSAGPPCRSTARPLRWEARWRPGRTSCDVGDTSAAGDAELATTAQDDDQGPVLLRHELKLRYQRDPRQIVAAPLNAKPINFVNNGNKAATLSMWWTPTPSIRWSLRFPGRVPDRRYGHLHRCHATSRS